VNWFYGRGNNGTEIEFDDIKTMILISKYKDGRQATRYSDADLAEFKEIILKKNRKSAIDLDLIKVLI
jgi:macrodomain Ter protein organizer (MatP/YcbG family)